jgi:protein SCO1/2
MRQYLNAFDNEFVGARGTAEALAPLLKSLNAIAVKVPIGEGNYMMDHTTVVYLIDADGHYRAVFSSPISVDGLRADLQGIAAAKAL